MADDSELFWPSLYGRLVPSRYDEDTAGLTDEDFADDGGAPQHFLNDFSTLQRHVQVELVQILNSTGLEASLGAKDYPGGDRPARGEKASYPFDAYPAVQLSILNYGLPAIIGRQALSLPLPVIEKRIREAIGAYEPRIRPETMRVRVTTEKGDTIDPERPLEFTIEGEIYGAPESLRVLINTLWDTEKVRTRAELER
ncbi:type VI secretion system baseplate subunit TssE [Rubrimonas cliftonensis]|uniref:Gene 25-like lysozyme n=1 Tax=Rubrimonas cliftonensis TaxID=89524 RepID=A0A1H4BHB6_9RHOB|nr:GPW/gp25 family protein [Rubrimonas cliftonensis]SEA47520.1 Gene 25-like lysozyme [Rubrimonas cliftonensis]